MEFDRATENIEVSAVADTRLDHGSAHDVRGPEGRFESSYRVFDPQRRRNSTS